MLAVDDLGSQLRAELTAMLRAVGTLMAFLRRPRLRAASEVYNEVKRWLFRLVRCVFLYVFLIVDNPSNT